MRRRLFWILGLVVVLLGFSTLGNDTRYEAISLDFNQVQYGSLDPASNLEDWYKIEVPQTGAFAIMVRIPEKTRHFLAWQRKTVHLYVGIYNENHLVDTLELFQTTKEKNLVQIYAGKSEKSVWYIQVSLQPIETSIHTALSNILATKYQIFATLTDQSYHLEEGRFHFFHFLHSPVDPDITSLFVVLEENEELDVDIVFLNFLEMNIDFFKPPTFVHGMFWCLNPQSYDWIGWRFAKDQIDPFSEEKYPLMGWFYGRNLWTENMSGTYDPEGSYIHMLFSWQIPGYTPVIPDEFYIAIKVVAQEGSGNFWIFSFSVPGFEE